MGEWLKLKKVGGNIGKIGVPLSDFREWSLAYRIPCTSSELGASQASQLAYDRSAMVEENKFQLAKSLGRSRTLE